MDDLIERLRLHKSWRDSHGELNSAPNEAADELDRLRASPLTTERKEAVAIDTIARTLAKSEGLNWDERCGYEISESDPTAPEECDSGTCVAAHYEDHDPGVARSRYLSQARAIIALIAGPVSEGEGA